MKMKDVLAQSGLEAESGVSAARLEQLAKTATELAKDLRASQPSYALALAGGVRDAGYETTANGYVSRYEGEANLTLENGTRWNAVGHKPKGNAWIISKQGYIEFIKLD